MSTFSGSDVSRDYLSPIVMGDFLSGSDKGLISSKVLGELKSYPRKVASKFQSVKFNCFGGVTKYLRNINI